MKILKYFLIALGLILFSVTLLRLISIRGIVPDILLIYLVFVGTRQGALAGTLVGFFIGLFQDLYAPQDLGINCLIKSLLGYLTGIAEDKIFHINELGKTVLLMATVFVNDSLYALLSSSLKASGWFFIAKSLPTTVYTVLIGMILFYFSIRMKKRQRYA